MARRNRRATRPARREAALERRAAVQETTREPRETSRDTYRDPQRARARGRVVRAGAPRAVGEASPALDRTAHLERTFVVKDFRRLVITVGAMLVLLAVSGFAVNALIP